MGSSELQTLAPKLQSSDAITDVPTLLTLLSVPLDSLGLLPPRYRNYVDSDSVYPPTEYSTIRKYLPRIQRALITNVLPVWDKVLQENVAKLLVEQYFCPDSIHNLLPIAGQIASCAYATLLSFTESEHAINLLQKLAREYPLDRLFRVAFDDQVENEAKRNLQWEDCVRDVCMIPVKVANAFASKKSDEIPPSLENAAYFNNLSLRTEGLITSLAARSNSSAEKLSALSYLLTKLVNTGLFPPRLPTARSEPSFFLSTLPQIRSRILLTPEESYNNLWSDLLLTLPTLTLQSILTSLFSSLSILPDALILDGKATTRALVRRETLVLEGLVGRITPSPEREELWEVAIGVVLNMSREWNEAHARIFVCWVSGNGRDSKALDAFLDLVLETWASSEYIKHSLLSRHQYTTSLFLLTLSYFPPSSSSVQSLVSNPVFIRGMSTYISHMDHSVRRCGMLVAEEVAKLASKKLEFGDWEGRAGILDWAREVRSLMKGRDGVAELEMLEQQEGEETEILGVEVETTTLAAAKTVAQTAAHSYGSYPIRPSPTSKPDTYDSDDSLTGYASLPSSRSPSPSSDHLDEIEKDPSLNVGVKKVPRPVYLAQLGEFLRGTGMQVQKSDEPHEADRIEMALNVAEELVRKKRVYGTELDENAVNLIYGFLPLNNTFELDDFAEKRQGVVNALVACAPKKAAPALIEELFKNQYSTDQRFVAMTALAIGARELASLPVPPSLVPPEKTAFPSKMLPAPLHKRYITAGESNIDIVPLLMDEISKNSLSTERSAAEHHPELIRERRLRIQQPTRITEIAPHDPLNYFSHLTKPIQATSRMKFVDVAAEFFIVPLINRFWAFVRDEQAREERTSFQKGRERYQGAGTGMILNPVVLAQFLRTLGILVHASQNAPAWLAIIAPDALEVAVTIGTRPISHVEMEGDENEKEGEVQRQKEASVLTAALEVALFVLNGALEIDGGKILGLDHTTLVLAAGEWAGKVFASLEKGLKVPGGGSLQEAQLSRAVAGVLLKVDELSSKWRRSMLDTR